MKLISLIAMTAAAASPAFSETSRQLDAHEHGVGQLDIAFDGTQIAMELHAPGADIVGFEYAASSSEDRAAIDAAVGVLAKPLDLFVLPEAAGCSVVQASAELESEDDHDEDHDGEDHGHEDHDDDHAHDDHADEDHDDDHDHDDHADEDHADGDHDHEDHADADHADDDHDHEHDGDDDHDDHASGAGHTEFHAEYMLNCADPSAVSGITFAYFEAFPNALEVEVQVISDKGATSFEVERDAPALDLRGMF